VKRFPKLALVTNEESQVDSADFDASALSQGAPRPERNQSKKNFELVGLEDLRPAEQDRIRRQVEELLPKASIVAVAMTSRPWDLRPIVAKSGDPEPSMIRFAGTELRRNPQLAGRLRETFERLRTLKELSSGLLGWGTWEEEIWYRRPVVERTLAQTLATDPNLSIDQILQLAHSTVEEIVRWHERGVVHGHLTSSNVVTKQNGRLALVDPGIGLGLLQCSRGVSEYNLQSFAPEVVGGQNAAFSSDLYGLGLVFRRLSAAIEKRLQESGKAQSVSEIVRPLSDLSGALIESDPNRRPPLAQARKTVNDILQQYSEAEKKVRPKGRPTGNIQGQGKILRPGSVRPAAEQRTQPQPTADRPQHESVENRNVGPRNTESERAQTPQSAPHPQTHVENMQQHYHQQFPPPAYAQPVPHAQYPSGQPDIYSGGPHVHTNVYQTMSQAQPVPLQQAPQTMQSQPMYAPPGGYPVQYGAPPQHYPPQNFPQQGYSPQGYPPNYQPPGMPQPGYVQPLYPPPVDGGQGYRGGEEKREQNLLPWLCCFGVLLVGFLFYRVDGFDRLFFSHQQEMVEVFKQEWNSRIPSRMRPVALAAVSRDRNSSAAESVILASIRTTDLSSAGINLGLLRNAFDDRWEMELGPEDRRAALALGLGTLLKQEDFPRDLPSLDQLHPGVLFALTASVSKASTANFLAGIPAERLVQLPPPYGPAFHELVEAHPMLRCADESVQRLARLAANGVDLDEVALFLKEEVPVRLRALAILYSHDNSRAKVLLDILVKDTNANIDSDYIKWGKAFGIDQWNELEPGDRLFVLAGIQPAAAVAPANLGKLLAHPEPRLRAYAIHHAMSAVRMEHPGALEVLRVLEREPTLLNPTQTVDLLKFLVSPGGQSLEAVRAWLQTNPPLQILEPLLVSSASAKKGTLLDTAIAVYLKGKSWKPKMDVLKKLTAHPDAYTRLFAYNELYLMQDRETAREILAEAQKGETEKENQQQLAQMLLELSH